METLWQDLRYGLRMLRTSPGFTLIAVFSLALGIGANTSIFSIVNAVLLRPLPVAEPEQLVFVFNGSRSSPYSTSSYPDYVDYRDRNEVFSDLFAYGGISVSLSRDDLPEQVSGLIVTGNYFDALGVRAALGRTFLPEENQTPGAHPVVVIGHGLWQRRFGGAPDVIGQQLTLNGHSFTIVGVAPAGFNGVEVFEAYDLYVPMMMQALVRPPRGGFSGEMNPDLLARRGAGWLSIVGRLKPGVTIEQAQAAMTTIAGQLEQAYPDTNRGRIATLFPVNKVDPRAYTQLLSVAALLMAVVAMVLLIACANVANLLLARASARRKEIAMRLALGASRLRIVRQLLTESILLSALGGLVGLLLAVWTIDVLKTTPPPEGIFSFTLDYRLDGRVLGFTLVLSLLTGIIFGLAPALQATRPDLVPALKDDSSGTGQYNRRFSLRNLLVVAQVALSLVLLIGAGLFLRSLRQAQGIDPGFDAEKVLTASLNINLLRYTKAQGKEFYRRVIEQVEALPGVEAASLARVVPMSGGGRTNSLLIEGQTGPDNVSRSEGTGSPDENPHTVSTNVIGLNYFKTMGIPLLRGRDFTAQDGEEAPGVVIVNEAFVQRHFAGEDPLGKRLSFRGSRGPWMEIVGVVRDSKYRTLGETPTPFAYQPVAQQHETGMTLHVRAASDPLSIAAAVRREVQALEKNLPLTDLQPLTALISSSLYPARMGAALLGVFGLLALTLAAAGLYGVLSYAVSRRTREIGIRMALGAQTGNVLRLVLKDGMTLVIVGIALGWTAAAFVTQLIASFLYGISPMDAATFAVIPMMLALVALLASYLPARRATKVDPMVALRYE
ncbi:MAG TPA: ABC transporter permease [Blastocatellia bacterium]|nr:ABC transporter permease [Blastocatellia bacterium]